MIYTKGRLLGTLVCMLLSVSAFSANYYLDAVNGNDNNNGLSPATAWKTLAKPNTVLFDPGSVISFKTAQRFVGVLTISSSGKAGAPIIYTTYGGTEPAIIDGNGDSTAVYSFNKEYIELIFSAVFISLTRMPAHCIIFI
jgi:hypothetical protein